MMQSRVFILTIAVLACNRAQKSKLEDDANVERARAIPQPPVGELVRIKGGHIRVRDQWCFPGSHREKYPGKKQTPIVDVEVQPFAIDREPALCHDLEKCFEAGQCKERGIRIVECIAGVANIPFAAAEAFCAWRGMKVPTYAQWQRAMRGPEGFTYPRGNEWTDEYLSDQGTTERGRRYVSPEGVVYFITEFGAWLDKEFTRDTDCLTGPAAETFRVAAGVRQSLGSSAGGYFELDTRAPMPDDATTPAQVRCVAE